MANMFVIIGFLAVLASVYSVQYVPDYTQLTYANDKYVHNCSVYIKRYGRKSPYYYNLEVGIHHAFGNNVTLHLVFYEYQHNQYMRSFVEFHLKLCYMLHHDPYFGKAFNIILSKHSVTCPLIPGMYRLNNLTLPTKSIPNVLPFVKGKVEAIFQRLPNQEVMLKIDTLFHIKP